MWKLQQQERLKGMHRNVCSANLQRQLNWSNFDPVRLYGHTNERAQEVEVLDADGNHIEVLEEEAAAIGATRFNSSVVCFIEGGVTGSRA
eukprot:3621482-Rhodomonas_salina.1